MDLLSCLTPLPAPHGLALDAPVLAAVLERSELAHVADVFEAAPVGHEPKVAAGIKQLDRLTNLKDRSVSSP